MTHIRSSWLIVHLPSGGSGSAARAWTGATSVASASRLLILSPFPIILSAVSTARKCGGRVQRRMFIDENSVWPRPEPPPPKPSRGSDVTARVFLVLALLVAFMPFSLGSCAAVVVYVSDRW